jgi:hypothetical protein
MGDQGSTQMINKYILIMGDQGSTRMIIKKSCLAWVVKLVLK